jgi:hypothetical protein
MSSLKTIGWIGLDVPVEIIEAAGYRARRLDADPAKAGAAAAYGEGGGHPWMRAMAGEILAEGASFDRVIIGAMPVTGVWLYNFLLSLSGAPGAPVLPPAVLFNLSHEQRPSAARLNRQSVDGLVQALGVGAAALADAIALRNAVRRMQRRVDGLRHGPRPRLTGSEARSLIDSADVMPAQAFLAGASQAPTGSGVADPGIPVIYSGPGSRDLSLYHALEARGITVVGDDADFGSRAIGPDVAEGEDSAQALALRYRDRFPAPAGWSTRARTAWLLDLCRARGALAVVFDLPDWAHPPAWDFPAQRQALEDLGVRWVLAPQAPAEQAADAVAQQLKDARP